VPTTKVHPGQALTNGHPVAELKEHAVIVHLRDLLADAASESREASRDDPRRAARRAAVDIATAILSASSTETAAHSDDVGVISQGIGLSLGLSGQQLEDLKVAARLHDIGKVGVPLPILEKSGPLDRAEWATIHRHTIIGEQILLSVPELRGAARLVRHSHERWDGTGYPDKLAGEEAPLASRIVFCADAFHAIRSDRPYRRGRTAAEALDEIRACAGTQFDPEVVAALEVLAGELHAARRGQSQYGRAARLMALLLIVSVGATGSALARSGAFPDADPSKPSPAGGALDAAGAIDSGPSNPLTLSAGGWPGGTSAIPSPSALRAGALRVIGTVDEAGHGQGIGGGTGDTNHDALDHLDNISASSEYVASSLKAKRHSKSRGSGRSKATTSHAHKPSGASPAPHSATTPKNGHSGSSHASPSQHGSPASASTAAKPSQPVKPPKADSPPARSPVTGVPPPVENGNAGSKAEGGGDASG
jgi:hypothetical protein